MLCSSLPQAARRLIPLLDRVLVQSTARTPSADDTLMTMLTSAALVFR